MTRHRRGELMRKIILLIATGVAIPASFVLPNLPKALRPLMRELQKSLSARPDVIHKSLTALKRKRLIKIQEKGTTIIFTLSELGRKRVLSFKFDEMTIPKPKKWDGYWRLVLFDIPEKQKREREVLRRKLRHLNFYQLQKSCFVHPFNCKDEIDFVTEFLGISHYVNFIVAKSVEGENELRNYYEL